MFSQILRISCENQVESELSPTFKQKLRPFSRVLASWGALEGSSRGVLKSFLGSLGSVYDGSLGLNRPEAFLERVSSGSPAIGASTCGWATNSNTGASKANSQNECRISFWRLPFPIGFSSVLFSKLGICFGEQIMLRTQRSDSYGFVFRARCR